MRNNKIIDSYKKIKYIIFLCICSLMIGVSALSVSRLVGEIVNYYITFGNKRRILLYTIIFFCALCVFVLFKHFFYKTTISINTDLKNKVYEILIDSKIDESKNREAGKVITLIEKDTSSLSQFLEDKLPLMIESVISAFLMGIVTFTIDRFMFIVIMLLSIVSGLSVLLYSKTNKIEKYYLEKVDELNGKSIDLIKGIPILNSLQNVEILMSKILDVVDNSCTLNYKNRVIIVVFESLTHLSSVARELFVVFYGLYFAGMDVGTVVTTLNITSFFGEIVKSTGELLIQFAKVSASIRRIESVLAREKESIEYEAYDKQIDVVEIQNLTYSYSELNGLTGRSFVLNKGVVNIIMGEVGTGKTTFGKIISGLISHQKGRIIVNDTEVSIKQLRGMVAYVDQDTTISYGTIAENVSAFSDKISYEKVIDCITRVGLKEWVDSLDDSINTELDAEVMNLSGGQKQRLAIARALFKDSPIIVLDEPTSSLDNENVKKISNQIKEICENKIIVVITHDLKLVEQLNENSKLIVFEEE